MALLVITNCLRVRAWIIPFGRLWASAPTLVRTATVADRYSNSYFRVSGPLTRYAGSQACAECHAPFVNTVKQTRHASAFTNARFEADGGQTNSSCLACHTVGFDVKTGFVSQKKTPHLAGVQCENCHGPAANHAANPDDPTVRPRAEVASQVCGGCHNDAHSPTNGTFAEWTNSAHAQVTNQVEDMNAANQINSCGRCHSGSVRLSLLEGNPLPEGDADIGIVCATCHDPHQTNSISRATAQSHRVHERLLHAHAMAHSPATTIPGSMFAPSATITRARRGPITRASRITPGSTTCYLGTIGELESGLPSYQPGSHALLITNQCVGCHMQTTPFVSEAQPASRVTALRWKRMPSASTAMACLNRCSHRSWNL